MKNHWLWMVIGCGLPLLFIFLAPSFGIGGGATLFIFIIAMFAVHLFMPHGSHGHSNHDGHNDTNHKQDNEESPGKTQKEEHTGHHHH